MTENFSKLKVVWRTHRGGSGRTQQDYLDFVVNGQSLYELLRPGDNIGCLGWLSPDVERTILEELTAERLSELGNDHYPIYICAECGDIGCGAFTVQIEKTEDGFLWRNFGYQNNYDKSMSDFESYEKIGPFYFERSEYLETVKSRQNLNKGSHKNQKAS